MPIFSMKPLFKNRKLSALEAQYEAHKIAYAPIIFQAVRSMRDLGVLEALEKAGRGGMDADSIASRTNLSTYAVDTLLESGLSCGVVEQIDKQNFALSKIGWFLLNDTMTRINMDYNHYVCYKGLYDLDKSLESEKPEGLKVFGAQWETLYQALPHLPDEVKNAWYAFDHYYSDGTYPLVLPLVLDRPVGHLLDIGANVGKFSILAANADPDLTITMLDLPDQLQNALNNVAAAGLSDRIRGLALDLLHPQAEIPSGADVYWLSQFLSCFGSEEIISILERIKTAMRADSRLFILETCWDRQEHEAAAYSLINTSPYFTCMASGNSKMYSAKALLEHIQAAGLKLHELHDNLGICHSLFECRI
ncbi:SAM-dependent methyltransferase [Thiolapillus brandeum]|nr:class I SAM-dependent methyltransferase [Thiolapillus brandeum]